MKISDYLKFLWDEVRDEARRARASRLRFDVARRFNALHCDPRKCLIGNLPPGGKPSRWMCPTCNKVHEALEWSVFTGWQFPACCQFPVGYRDGGIHAVCKFLDLPL